VDIIATEISSRGNRTVANSNSNSQMTGSPRPLRIKNDRSRARFESILMKSDAKTRSVTVGIFDNVQDLERAVERLAAAGFEDTLYDEAIVALDAGNIAPVGAVPIGRVLVPGIVAEVSGSVEPDLSVFRTLPPASIWPKRVEIFAANWTPPLSLSRARIISPRAGSLFIADKISVGWMGLRAPAVLM
jgi:hypothetical protein